MKQLLFHTIPLLKKIGLLLFIYTICRMAFYLFNQTYFAEVSFIELIIHLFYGLKFDISTIIITNSVFLFLYLIPFPFRSHELYLSITNGLFYLVNSFAILLNCIDIAYFKFIFKRSTADVFDLIATGNDFISLIPIFLIDYWYIVLIWIALTTLFVWGNRKADFNPRNSVKFNYPVEFIFFILSICIAIIGYRGGFQLKPITIINAGEYTSSKNIPLLINTPFSIIKTIEAANIEERNYFSETEVKKIFNPLKRYENKQFQPFNVVILVMESFSKEYIGALNNGKGYTPFLDSLISKSLVFDNAFANGKKSMEGIPAILAGIPALMTEPYITSNYGSNRISSLASILGSKGYSTSFYHGGSNGTMGFDSFTKLAGVNKYVGRKEYDNEKDFDGSWGIWDEPFFQYFAEHISQEKQPFLGIFFSLSSHHPYKVPDKYKSVFEEGSLPIHKSIRYADFSLRKFFSAASKMPWFDSTLFIITADHTGAGSEIVENEIEMHRIPVIFYKRHSELKGINHSVIQQIDIMPSLLHYLGYSEPFFAFGNSVFDSTSNHYAVHFINETYQLIQNDYALHFNRDSAITLFNYEQDKILANNLIAADTLNKKELEKQLKAIIQTFNYSLIHNKMIVE